MRKFVEILIVGVLMGVIFLAGCNKTEDRVNNPSEKFEQTDDKGITSENTSDVAEDVKRNGGYFDGFWSNGEVTYYFYSFIQNNEEIFYFTGTDKPDTWFQYNIISSEIIQPPKGSDYYYELYTVEIISSSGEQMQGTISEVKDNLFTQITIAFGEEMMSLEKIDFNWGYHEYANEMKFTTVNPSEDGGVELSHIDLTGQKYIYIYGPKIFNDMNVGYYSIDNLGNIEFHEGPLENFDENNVVEIAYHVAKEYNFVEFPNVADTVETGETEKIELPDDIFAGYLIKDTLGNSYLYTGAEDLKLREYHFDGEMIFGMGDLLLWHNGITAERYNNCIAAEGAEWVYSESWGEGYMNAEDSQGGTEVYLETDKGYFAIDVSVYSKTDGVYVRLDRYSDLMPTGSDITKVVDSLIPSTEGVTLEQHIFDTLDFNGYKLKTSLSLSSVHQNQNAINGISVVGIYIPELSNMYFKYYGQEADVWPKEYYVENTKYGDALEIVYYVEGETPNIIVSAPDGKSGILRIWCKGATVEQLVGCLDYILEIR